MMDDYHLQSVASICVNEGQASFSFLLYCGSLATGLYSR